MKPVHYLIIALLLQCATLSFASDLPVCSNRVINQVTTRVGCTVGDAKCWLTKGGFCTDYIAKKSRRGKSGPSPQLIPVSSNKLSKGDIAQFNSRAHYAYVESVVRDSTGAPRAVNLSEYNYGTCWVDPDTMVTDQYFVVNRRSGVAIDSVDGGFLRPR